jgi:TolA-binding protein
MKNLLTFRSKRSGVVLCALLCAASPLLAQEDAAQPRSARSGSGAGAEDLRAQRMIENGLELMASNQQERGLGMIQAVGKMFPESKVRFRAALELARWHQEKNQFPEALTALQTARQSEDPAELAEAWFRLGAIQFQQGQINEAFASLRRVTNDYPDSLFANHAFETIGQGHFKQGRWGKAVEAFRMVGTAVPADLIQGDEVLAEAGQRLFVKVSDKDLRILHLLGQKLTVTLRAESGDEETVELTPLGRGGEDWLASVRMAPEASQPNDALLSVRGGEWITVTYLDNNNAEGKTDVPLSSRVRIVSTGNVSFTDGAYNRSVRGLFAGQPAYVRLTDLDLDRSAKPDSTEAKVTALYKVEKPKEEGVIPGVDVNALEEEKEEWAERSSITIRLTETAANSGEFRGSFRPFTTGGEAGDIEIMPGDELVVSYSDETHLRGTTPEDRSARVAVVVGGSTEPQSIVSVANDAVTQGRKLLIEAQLLHRWASIFKDVGLDDSAFTKAEEGLEKVQEILALTARQSIERGLLEQTFATKWDLFLVQGKLNEAIATCQALVRLFPDTPLVDRAFLNIARARSESESEADKMESIKVYRQVLALPESTNKAEAQFRIGEVTEELIKMRTKAGQQPNFAPAMMEYQRCAESYPNSPFAGEAFNKIINYQIGLRDYVRSVELMDRVVQDYPDAPWLDEILLKWGVVAHRMGNPDTAVQKFMQVLEEYPNGNAAGQAAQFLQKLQ